MTHINLFRRPSHLASIVALVVLLAACGSTGGGGSNQGAASASASTVSTKQVGGIGAVLVDAKGMVLYSPDEESGGKVLCMGQCTSIWMPLSASSPTAAPGVADLGTITRSDGTTQVTAGGRPLYTFAEDSPGDVKGNGASDDFAGQHFTWHAVMADGTLAGSTPTTSGGVPAYGGY
jgi:predicted lipoprotein with Yx(FWY)xxD motif